MLFDDFDRDLVRQLFEAMSRGDDWVFHDPSYPYQATLKKDGEAYVVTVEDTRKRWWGRQLSKRRVTDKYVRGSSTQGPAFEALMMVKHWIEDDRRQAANNPSNSSGS